MPFPAGVEIDPPGLIEAWRRDVASRSGVSNGQPRWARQHAMNLRARTPRGHLTEIASNRRRPKREAPTTTEDPARKKLKGMDSTNVTPMKQKKRGRPSAEDIVRRRQLENQEQSEQSINLGPLVPGSVPSLPPSEAGSRLFSSRKKSASPSKRSRTLDQTKSPAAIDLTFLETCKPSTKMRIFSEVRQKGIDIPAAVLHLHEKLLDTPEGFIPSELKVRCYLFQGSIRFVTNMAHTRVGSLQAGCEHASEIGQKSKRPGLYGSWSHIVP